MALNRTNLAHQHRCHLSKVESQVLEQLQNVFSEDSDGSERLVASVGGKIDLVTKLILFNAIAS
jgi:hypothetical protein